MCFHAQLTSKNKLAREREPSRVRFLVRSANEVSQLGRLMSWRKPSWLSSQPYESYL